MNIEEFRERMAADAANEAQRRREREAKQEAYWEELGAELDRNPICAYRGRGRGRGSQALEPKAEDEPCF